MNVQSTARRLIIISGLLIVAGCGLPPSSSAYQNRGTPESLLDISSEIVSLNTATNADIAELSSWIARDLPSRAELNCDPRDGVCRKADALLRKHNVPVTSGTTGAQAVTLIYQRIVARDCDPSFVDNAHDYYNTNHQAFGCSVAANIVQHVTDKQEFINPAMMDDPSAVSAVNAMKRANTPRPAIKPYTTEDSIINKARTE